MVRGWSLDVRRAGGIAGGCGVAKGAGGEDAGAVLVVLSLPEGGRTGGTELEGSRRAVYVALLCRIGRGGGVREVVGETEKRVTEVKLSVPCNSSFDSPPTTLTLSNALPPPLPLLPSPPLPIPFVPLGFVKFVLNPVPPSPPPS